MLSTVVIACSRVQLTFFFGGLYLAPTANDDNEIIGDGERTGNFLLLRLVKRLTAATVPTTRADDLLSSHKTTFESALDFRSNRFVRHDFNSPDLHEQTHQLKNSTFGGGVERKPMDEATSTNDGG